MLEISLRNSGLLSAAVFVSQAYPSSGFADSKPRIRGMYPGNLLSACLLYAPDQCDWVPQASPVGAPGSAIVNPCFSRRPAAFHAPLFCAVGKYQLFPVSGTLLSGYVSGSCGIWLFTLSVLSVVGLIVSVVISIVLAYLCWILIERKFTGWLRRILLR